MEAMAEFMSDGGDIPEITGEAQRDIVPEGEGHVHTESPAGLSRSGIAILATFIELKYAFQERNPPNGADGFPFAVGNCPVSPSLDTNIFC